MMSTESKEYRTQFQRTAGFVLWGLVWVAAVAIARFGPELIWNHHTVAGWTAVAVTVLAGALWIIAFTRFLRSLDDLQRKIMLDALAVTLGVGWIVGFGYVVAAGADLVPSDINPALLPGLLAVVYLIAYFIGRIRYR